jgi:hypothetical protein
MGILTRGSGWVDATSDAIERAEARLAELNELLTEAGKRYRREA